MSEHAQGRPTGPTPAIDGAVLAALVEALGRVDADAVVEMFVEAAPGRADAIVAACESGDADAAGRLAHTLRSTAALLGAHDLARAARALQDAAAPDTVAGADWSAAGTVVVDELRRAADELARRA